MSFLYITTVQYHYIFIKNEIKIVGGLVSPFLFSQLSFSIIHIVNTIQYT